MKKNLHFRVTGNVQGVFFRDSTKAYAEDQGLQGIVRNEPDGSVYIEAEGDVAQLRNLAEWLEHGSSAAHVDSVWKDEGTVQNYEGFTVTG